MAHNKQTGARARSEIQFALIDKAYCGECGEPLVADSTKKARKKPATEKPYYSLSVTSTLNLMSAIHDATNVEYGYDPDYIHYRWYVCRGTKNKAYLNGCQKRRIDKNLLEQKVVQFAATQYLTDENINRIAKATTKLQAGRPSQKEIKEYEKQIQSENTKINNLMKMIEDGFGTKTAYERVAQAEQRIEVAQQSIAKIKEQHAPDMTLEEFKNKLVAIREKMQSFFKDGKIPDNVIKEFCDIFITAVYVFDDDDGGTRVKIIFDELETDGLTGFNEAEIELGSIINISGSPSK